MYIFIYEENHIIKKVFRSALKVLFFVEKVYVVHEIKYKTSKEIRVDTSIPVYIEHTYSYVLVILRLWIKFSGFAQSEMISLDFVKPTLCALGNNRTAHYF